MQIAARRDSHPTTESAEQLKDIRKRLPFRVLSESDWRRWTTKGYVVVRQAVPISPWRPATS